jgi:hypothetical protein
MRFIIDANDENRFYGKLLCQLRRTGTARRRGAKDEALLLLDPDLAQELRVPGKLKKK